MPRSQAKYPDAPDTQNPEPGLEISLDTAEELVALQVGMFVDVRQTLEGELEGEIPGALSIPLFQVKTLLGQPLSEEEQEILDMDVPDEADIQSFLSQINHLHFASSQMLFCICNSGQRSLHAARLFRNLGYVRTYSVRGGFRAWRGARERKHPA